MVIFSFFQQYYPYSELEKEQCLQGGFFVVFLFVLVLVLFILFKLAKTNLFEKYPWASSVVNDAFTFAIDKIISIEHLAEIVSYIIATNPSDNEKVYDSPHSSFLFFLNTDNLIDQQSKEICI